MATIPTVHVQVVYHPKGLGWRIKLLRAIARLLGMGAGPDPQTVETADDETTSEYDNHRGGDHWRKERVE